MCDEERFAKAIAYAAKKHAKQVRKDGTPYIYHPMAVAELVKRGGYGIEYQIAAVLHDVFEYTDATENEVKEFGDNIFEAVALLTQKEGINEEEYVENILKNTIAAVVRNADKIHDLTEIVSYGISVNDKNVILEAVKKVRPYYENKFSEALDYAIGYADYMGHNWGREEKPPYYKAEEIKLYSDVKEENRKKAYERYVKNTDIPDLNNEDMKFAIMDNGGPFYYCYLKGDDFLNIRKTWMLTQFGWTERKNTKYGNIFETFRHDIDVVTKEYFINQVKALFSEGWFYDFVEKEKVIN